MARDENAKNYRPAPIGITYWRKTEIETDGGKRDTWYPLNRPFASIAANHLENEDISALLHMLLAEARRRGMTCQTLEDLFEIQARDLAECHDPQSIWMAGDLGDVLKHPAFGMHTSIG